MSNTKVWNKDHSISCELQVFHLNSKRIFFIPENVNISILNFCGLRISCPCFYLFGLSSLDTAEGGLGMWPPDVVELHSLAVNCS